jgi:hypothetical protein
MGSTLKLRVDRVATARRSDTRVAPTAIECVPCGDGPGVLARIDHAQDACATSPKKAAAFYSGWIRLDYLRQKTSTKP